MQIKIIAVGSSWWERFIRRWGVSFLIGEDVLFDTFGDPCLFLRNAQRLNIDFSKIKHIVISHDDWDHISGLWYIINRYKDVVVYICPNFKQEIKDRIVSFGVKIIEVSGLLKIKDNVYSTGQMEDESGGRTIAEQSLIIQSKDRIILITGCAHPGIINIVRNIKERFTEKIHLVIGGLHLKDSGKEQIQEVITQLRMNGIEKIAPMHCTGKLAMNLLKTEYKDNFVHLKPADTIEV